MVHRASAFLLVVVLAWRAAAAQQLPSPSYQTGVSLVIVDVTVLSRSGEALTDLTQGDFTLTVDGTPRRIVSYRLVRADRPQAEVASPSPTTADALPVPPRRFVIVIDRDHIPVGEGRQMLAAGAQFVDALPPGDLVATWALDAPTTTLRFGTDREAVKAVLRQSAGTYRPVYGPYVVARDEAIPIDEGDRDMLSAVVARECRQMPPGCPAEVQAMALQVARDARDRAERALNGLEVLVKALGSVPGPKHLVLITGGPVATRDAIGTLSLITAQAASSRVTIHALQVADTLLNIQTLRAQPRQVDQTQSIAYSLASGTGGLALTPASGEVAFDRLARELAATYELTFEPEAGDRDGKEHRIGVRVADRGFGVSVRARRSFRIYSSLAIATSPTPAVRPGVPTEPAEPPEPEAPAEAFIPGPVDVPSLTTGLASYATHFEQEFSAVVAEERYVQVVHPWRGNPRGPDAEPSLVWQEDGTSPEKKSGPVISRRQLLSDVLLVQLQEAQWLGYRDVAVVDGRPVRDRSDRVRDLFLSQSANRENQLRAIAEESSRYNLGDFRRNMNVPTLTLGFMRPRDQWRFKFKRQKDEKVDGRPARVLSFKEDARPTLIGTRSGGDVPIEGRVWIDAATGAVLRTELRFETGSQRRSYVRTDFGSTPGLDVLVPLRMWEWYEGADQLGRIGGDKTLVQCLATYGNFRRFQVTTSEGIK